MEENFVIDNISYSVYYDKNSLDKILEHLGLINGSKFIALALLCYPCAGNKLKKVWNALSLKSGLSPSTVAVHIRNGLISAEYNGGLKNIDDVLGVDFYDYDFGLTSKNFLAVLSRHLVKNGIIIAKIVEK